MSGTKRLGNVVARADSHGIEYVSTAVEREYADRHSKTLVESAKAFFDGSSELQPEVIEGILREAQIGILAARYGIGKSPILADIGIHTINGIEWCGRRIDKRPVIAFDFENSGPTYRRNLKSMAQKLQVRIPKSEDMEVYLMNDLRNEAQTDALLSLSDGDRGLKFLKEALSRKPNALVLIDPVEMFSPMDKMKGPEILTFYRGVRRLLSAYPKAAVLMTFNLRKKDRRATSAPNLLNAPRDWLEEVSGSLDILNRCDVRLGVDIHQDEIRVINGIRRGEDMHPILLRPVGEPPNNLAGFCRVVPDQFDLLGSLSSQQKKYWDQLPAEYRFEDVADKTVPRSSLSRLNNAAKSLGILEEHDGLFRKVALRTD